MKQLYVVKYQYTDKKPFLFGNVISHPKAKEHELAKLFSEAWKTISPHPEPPSIQFIPGYIWFTEEE